MTMKNYLYGILAIALLAFTACTKEELSAPQPAPEPDVPAEYQSGEVLVKFAPYVSDILDREGITRSGGPATRSGILSVDEILDIVGGYQIERVFPVDPRNEERTRESELHLWYVVRFGEEFTAAEVAEKLSALGEVQHVSFNRTIHRAYNAGKKAMPLSRKTLEAIQHQRATRTGEASAYPFDDLLLPQQWHLVNRGNMFGEKSIVDADVQCEQAWELSTGDESIVVAVLDEGVMIEHPDLKNNMWVNENEIYRSHEDNDGNGYQGDVYGYNFVKNTGVISWDDVSDTGHGTHVAGVIAAQNNNGIGISSIAGGDGNIPGAKIMSCQIFSGDTAGNALSTVKAIKYAADNGAAIIQCSYGYPAGSVTSDAAYSSGASAEKQAIDYFIAKQNCAAIEGGLAIFAAGNDLTGISGYPGAYRDYISVTAMSCDYTPAYYTNYGPGCNIAAPGGDAYQSYLENINTGAYEVLSTVNGGKYGYMQGTSMACPHVSGVAALGLSYALQLGKTFTQNEFTTLLLTSVNDINQYCTGTKQYFTDKGSLATLDLSQYKKGMGTGYIDAYQVLMNVRGITCIPIPVGSQYTLNLQPYLGGGNLDLKITEISISAEDMNRLGISANPTIFANQIILKCTKPGSAVVRIKLLAGNGNNSGMNGMPITKEFAFIAREVHSQNGGWL